VAKQEATIAQQRKEIEATAAQQQKEIQSAIARQRKEMDAVIARLKEQAEQIQKVSAQLAAASPSRGGLEVDKPAPRVVSGSR
jgi:septal ring factor EnvC (AmiA/AmiB activator)